MDQEKEFSHSKCKTCFICRFSSTKEAKNITMGEFLKRFGESEGMFSISHNDSVCSHKIKMEI